MSLFLSSLLVWAGAGSPERPPNVVLIVTDDQGWADVGCYSGEVSTPNIDRLATEGVRFTQAYASASTCSASRAGLLTGRYQQRFGFYGNLDSKLGIPDEETTLAESLRPGGHRTGLVGKWHLGKKKPPLRHGFDEFYGFTGMGHSYVDLTMAGTPTNPLWRDDTPIDDEGYLTDRLTDEAIAFVERNRERPFFLYLSYNAPHLPLEPPPGWPESESESEEERERHAFLGILANLDAGIGRLLDALTAAELDEETLVIFLSDNGGSTDKNRSRNGPFRGKKHELWEGGIRVPLLMRWTGTVPAGRVVEAPVSTLDVFATCLRATGAERPQAPLDGMDLFPLVRGEDGARGHELLHWIDDEENWAVRRGPWKLVQMQLDYQLFHLDEDPHETDDRYPREKDLVLDLLKVHGRFAEELPKRLWRYPHERGKRSEESGG